MDDTHARVGIYVRISQDARKDEAGVERQLKDCRALIENNGWVEVDVYNDNDRSATNGKERSHWERLLADVRSGRIDRIVAWARDRLSRGPMDAAHLEQAALDHGVMITIHPGHDYDLSDPVEAFQFRTLGNVASLEIGIKVKRQKARNVQDLERGFPHLRGRVFGYLPNPDKIGRAKQNPWDCTVTDEREATTVKWLFAQVLNGNDNIHGLAMQVNEAGITTVKGEPWTSGSVHRVLRNPLYGGIQYRVEKDGAKRDYVLYPDIPTQWKALVSKEDWFAVRDIMNARKSKNERGVRGPRKSWLSGVLTCGVCNKALHQNKKQMVCRAVGHGLGIDTDLVRGVVEPYIFRRVAMMGQAFKLADPQAVRIDLIRTRLAQIESEDLPTVRGIKSLSMRVAEMNKLTDEQDALQDELAHINASRSLTGVIADLLPIATGGVVSFDTITENQELVAQSWEKLGMTQQNKIAKAMGKYVIAKAAAGVWGKARVKIYPRDFLTGELQAMDEDSTPME